MKIVITKKKYTNCLLKKVRTFKH